MSWSELAAIGGIAIAILTPITKWLISDWFKKATELEELKERKQNESINALRGQVSAFKGQIKSMNIEILNFYTKIEDVEKKLFQSCQVLDRVKSDICGVCKTNERITTELEVLIRQEVKTQVVQLTKDIKIFKTKA